MLSRCRPFSLAGLVFAAVFALAGCGFTPAFAPGGAGDSLRGAVVVTAPDTVTGFALRRQLNDRLGPLVAERFRLDTSLSLSQTPATITVDGDTTRFNLVGTAMWTLTDTTTGVVRTGRVETFSSYATTGSTVATQTAREDALVRLATALADLIVAQAVIAVETP